MKNIYSLLFSTFLASTMIGQMTDVGGPKSANVKVNLPAVKVTQKMPEFDLSATLATNAINEANKVGPYMFGYEHSVNYNLTNSGSWETLLNGDRIWRIKLQSEGALSLNFVFTDFEIPPGGHLHIYNPDKSIIIGAYVHANNTEDHTFGTELMKGDVAILEYYEPASQAQQGRLQLGTIVHGYKDINGWYTEKVNESGACNMDVMCPDGAPWQDESRAVAMIVNGGGICSVTLLNGGVDSCRYTICSRLRPTSSTVIVKSKYITPHTPWSTVISSKKIWNPILWHIIK